MKEKRFSKNARCATVSTALFTFMSLGAGSLLTANESNGEKYFFIENAESVNESVRFSSEFGAFNDSNFPWIYHYSLGWAFLGQASDHGFWMFSASMNAWLWSSERKFPHVFNTDDQAWGYFHFDGPDAWYFEHSQQTWNLVEHPQPENNDTNRDEAFYELAETSRFLSMATLGADYETIEAVHEQGIEAWLDTQFSLEPTFSYDRIIEVYPEILDWEHRSGGSPRAHMGIFHETMKYLMMTSEDQLRHKVALALSEILVVSTKDRAGNLPTRIARYYDILVEHAFGTYEELLLDVTFSPAMGSYLSHAGNQPADPQIGRFPDENYAREIMQLFTIGLSELNIDGSPVLDSQGEEIPTYTNDDITELARVFTGLFYDPSDHPNLSRVSTDRLFKRSFTNFEAPMLMFEEAHDSGEKTLLDNLVIPADTPGMEAIRVAVNHLVSHPNTGPFIGRQLIQRLVKSNPSPAYVARVARVFQDNGKGEQGDLAAVVRAILLDPEAIGSESVENAPGRMRGPYYRFMHLFRAFNAADASNRYLFSATWSYSGHEQSPLGSPTVFNFYRPDFQPQGVISDADMVAPEFQIADSRTMITYINGLDTALLAMPNTYDNYHASNNNPDKRRMNPKFFYGKAPEPFRFDYSGLESFDGDHAALVRRLDLVLTHGQMSRNTETAVTTALDELDNWDFNRRIAFAIYLIMISPDYVIMQ